MDKYIVYTEIINIGFPTERWYYGTYDHNRANEVALALKDMDSSWGVFYCVCKAEDAQELKVRNLPC